MKKKRKDNNEPSALQATIIRDLSFAMTKALRRLRECFIEMHRTFPQESKSAWIQSLLAEAVISASGRSGESGDILNARATKMLEFLISEQLEFLERNPHMKESE